MGVVSNIVCKTVGIAGMSYALYDAHKVGKAVSKNSAKGASAAHYEQVYAQTRTQDFPSPSTSMLQKRVADFRMSNPIIPITARIKGFCKGFFNSLGNNIIPVVLSAITILSKGTASKLGAIGLGGYFVYKVAHDGFGVGKVNLVE